MRTHSRRSRTLPRHNPPHIHKRKVKPAQRESHRIERKVEELLRRLLPVEQRQRVENLLHTYEYSCRFEGMYWQKPRRLLGNEALQQALRAHLRKDTAEYGADNLRALIVGYNVLHGEDPNEPLTEEEERHAFNVMAALEAIDLASITGDRTAIRRTNDRLLEVLREEEVSE